MGSSAMALRCELNARYKGNCELNAWCRVENDSVPVCVDGRQIFIVAETAAAIEHEGITNETPLEPSRLARTRGPNGTISETCSLEIPREANGVPLVIVYDALRETSSLASA